MGLDDIKSPKPLFLWDLRIDVLREMELGNFRLRPLVGSVCGLSTVSMVETPVRWRILDTMGDYEKWDSVKKKWFVFAGGLTYVAGLMLPRDGVSPLFGFQLTDIQLMNSGYGLVRQIGFVHVRAAVPTC